MTCTACGETNRESARFCAGCGTPMHLACRECEATLSPRAKFCDQCGTPVVAAEPPPATVDDAVRKTISIVFADLVGSTSFQEQVDAETTRSEMASYHQLAQDVVERHGGHVAKFIGDGVMAVFGVPDVAEDDADRAVRSAMALQVAFAPIAERIRTVHGAEVGLRIGINSGEIVVAEDDDDMYGDALNTAARIEAQCTPGRVLVGEQTWRLTRSSITYEVLGEVALKGKADPVATFQVVDAPDTVDEIQAPFVGREHEIAALIEAVDASIEERSPVLVTVIGSPGVGKTRLAAEARAVAAPHAQTFDLRVDRAATSTFGPVADLVRRVIDVDEAAEPAEVVEQIATWIGDDGNAAELAPLLATFIGAGPARSTEESFWASRRLVEILAHRRPTLIVVDDIQWAQPLFLDLLDHLVEWVTGPAALICLARPEIREIRPALAETGRRVYDVVSLEGLAPGATAELAAGLLGGDELPPELADRLPESTEGNPLFVRELVRMLVDDGVIEQIGGTWQLAIDADAVEVPPTIQSLLASRVERMPADERRLVELASVVGSEFARGAIAALLPSAERAGLDALLERLRRKEIIDPTGTYWGDEPILRFHHVLIRDASYRRMLKQRRAELHVAVGEWTADAADRFGGEHEISIAFHFEQAFQLLTELGQADDAADLGRQAAALFRVAAERALAQDDLDAAGTLSARALACIDGPRDVRAALLLTACEAFFSAGNVHEGGPYLTELRELVAGDDRLTAWADAFEGQRIWATEPDRLNEIQPVIAAAAERLAELGDDAGVAKARFVQAIVLARLGRVGDCESELDAALTAARAADDRRRVTAVLGAAPQAALWGPSPVARAGGRCLDIIRLLRITSASPMVEATSVRCQAVLEAMRGRFEQARDLIARSRETVEELGLRHGILETAMYAGIIELYADEPAAAEPHLREAHAGLGRLGVGADAGQAAALLSEALLAQGRVDEAAELADESARLAGQNQRTAIASRAAQARIAVAQDRLDDAAALAQEAVDLASATDLTMDHARAASTLALVHERQGRASSAASDAAALFEAKGAERSETRIGLLPSTHEPSTDPALENAAMRETRAGIERMARGDEPGAVAPGWQMLDRRTVGTLNIDDGDRASLFYGDPAERPIYDIRALATRGDRCVLVAATGGWQNAEIDGSLLIVAEVDSAGRASTTVLFDPDDLRGAFIELNRLYAEGEGAAYAEPIHIGGQIAELMERGDGEAFRAMFAKDAVFRDERLAKLSSFPDDLDLAEYLPADADYVRRIVAINERGYVGEYVRDWDEDGGEFRDIGLILLLVADGRIAHLEQHPSTALPQLLKRFERLTAEPAESELNNLAVEAMRAALERIQGHREADPDARLATYEMVDNRRAGVMTLDGAGFAAAAEQARADGVRYTMTPLAIRGERVALVQLDQAWTVDDVHESMFALVEVNENGQHERTTFFDIDDLDAALTALTAAWIAGEAAPFASTVRTAAAVRNAFEAASREGDLPGDAPLHPDAKFQDHRPFGYPSMGPRDVSRTVSLPEHSDSISFVTTRFDRLNERGLVCRQQVLATASGARFGGASITVAVVRDGLLTNMEWFPPDAVDAAIARFDELTSSSQPAAHRLSNTATRAMGEGLARANAGAAPAEVASGWQMIDRRSGGMLTVDDSGRRSLFYGPESERPSYHPTTLAIRGDRCALIHGEGGWRDADINGDLLFVARYDTHGLADATVLFDAEDLRGALDELNRLYLEDEGAPFREIIEIAGTMARAKEDGDDAALGSLLADDVVFVDNRTTGGQFDRAQAVDWFRLVGASESDVSVFVPEYLRTSSDALLVRRIDVEARNGQQAEWEMLSLMKVTDGLVTTLEYFDSNDEERAIARFEELTTTPTALRNLATEWAEFSQRAMAEGRVEDGHTANAEGFVVEDHRFAGHGDGDGHTVEQAIEARLAMGATFTQEHVAIRGDRFALTSWGIDSPDDFTSTIQCVIEVNDDGLATRMAQFDETDLDAAELLLDQWYATSLEPVAQARFERFRRSVAAFASGDADAASEYMPQGLTVTDHRPGGFGTVDRAGWLDRFVSFHEVAPQLTIHHPAVHAVSDVAVLAMQAMSDGDGNEWRFIVIAAEPVEKIELFDVDDLEQATARYEELTSGETPDEATTEFERFWTPFQEAIATRDWACVDALISPDLTGQSNRRGWDGWQYTREFLGTVLRDSSDVFDGPGDQEVLSALGDHLALVRWHAVADESTLELVSVMEVYDGVLTRIDTWESDGLDAAYQHAAARFSATRPPEERVVVDATARAIGAFNAHDMDALRLHSPATLVDRRSGTHNFGTIDRDTYVERQRVLWEMTPGAVCYGSDLHALSARGILGGSVIDDGGGNRWDLLMLVVFADGEPTYGEFFDAADLDAALARFDELTGGPQTTAERVSAELIEAINEEQWEAVAALVADDFHARSARLGFGGTELDKELFIASVRHSRDMLGLCRVETVTTRGDRIAIHRLQFGGEDVDVDYLVTQRFDASGQLDRAVTFDLDEIIAAMEVANDWHLAPLPAPLRSVADVCYEVGFAASARDADRFRAALSPDFIAVDNRTEIANFGRLDREGMVARQEALWGLTDSITVGVTDTLALNERGLLIVGGTQDAEGNTWPILSIQVVRDGLVHRQELFDAHERERALARFAELTADPETPVRALANAAITGAKAWESALNAGDAQALRELCAPEMVFEDHRGVGSYDAATLEDAIESNRHFVEQGATYTLTPIAVRGDRFALVRTVVETGDGFRIAQYIVGEVDAAGRFTFMSFHGDDDHRGAHGLLTDRWLASPGAPPRRTLDALRRHLSALGESEEAVLATTTDDYLYVDHVPVGFGARTAAEVWAHGLPNEAGGRAARSPRIERISEHVVLTTLFAEIIDEDGTTKEWARLALAVEYGGVIARTEWFAPDDLDFALQRFELMDRIHNTTDGTLAERASRQLNDLVLAGDERVLLTTSRPDFEMVTARAETGLVVMDREMANDSILAWRSVGFTSSTSESLATRGEHLVLLHTTMETPDGQRIEVLNVGEIDSAGAGRRQWAFDPDQFDEAYALLNEWYIESLDAEPAAVVKTITDMQHARATGDDEAVARLCRPGGALVDRRGGQQLESRFDEFTGHTAERQMTGKVITERFHRLTGDGAVCEIRSHFTDADGMEVGWHTIAVDLVEGDQLGREEMFDAHAVEAACARFDALTETGDRTLAEQHIEQHRVLTELGRFDDLYDLYAPDWQFVDQRTAGLAEGATLDDVVDALRSRSEWSTEYTYDTLAVRGERVALFRVRMTAESGFEHQNLWVLETDELGRNRWSSQFDEGELRPALRALRNRWIDGEAAPFRRVIEATDRMGAALRDPGGHALASAVTDDFTLVDHRPVGFGEMTIEQYIASIPQIQERGDWLTFATAYHRLTDRGLVLTLASEVESESGIELDGERVVLFLVRDELVDRMEWFDVDNLDAALARFDNLTETVAVVLARRGDHLTLTEITGSLGVEYVLEDVRAGTVERFDADQIDEAIRALNAATLADVDPEIARWVVTAIAVGERMSAGEWDELRDLLTDDFRHVVWQPYALPESDRDGFIDNMRTWAEQSTGLRMLVDEVLDMNEQGCVWTHNIEGIDDRGAVNSWTGVSLILFEHGKVSYWEEWPLGNEAAALTQFEQRTTDWESHEFGEMLRLVLAVQAVGEATELQDVAELLAEHFVFVDHRALGFGTLDPHGYLDFVATAPPRSSSGSEIIRIAENACLGKAVFRSEGTEWGLLSLMTSEDGARMTRQELWDLDDVDAAIRRFEELTSGALANGAGELAAHFWRLVLTDGDADAAATLNAPDFETVDRRRLVGGQDLDAEGARHYTELVRTREPGSVTHDVDVLDTDGEDRALYRLTARAVDGSWSYDQLQAIELNASGLARRVTTYSPEDEARARTEFRARGTRADALTTHNRAAEIVIAENRELYVDKIVPADVRSTLVTFDYSPFRSFDLNDDAIFQQWFDEMVAPYEIELTPAVLDTVGDHLVLLRVTLDVEGVDFPVELLQLSRTDDSQSRETALFDVDAEDAARALLADWATE